MPSQFSIFLAPFSYPYKQSNHIAILIRVSLTCVLVSLAVAVPASRHVSARSGDVMNSNAASMRDFDTGDLTLSQLIDFDWLQPQNNVSLFNQLFNIRVTDKKKSAGRQEGLPPTCIPPPPGMVAWWPGEGNGNDIRGENNGTLEGVSFSNGKVEHAFSFTGLRGVVVPDSVVLNQQKFTIDAWFTTSTFTCPGGPGTCAAFIAAKSGSDGNSGYELDVRENGALNFFINGGLTGGHVGSVGTFADGLFHHVAATYDGSTMRLYIDGALNNSTAISVTPNYPANRPFIIGGRELTGPTVTYPGRIDEVEFFNRALNVGEIQQIFFADDRGKCRPRCTQIANTIVSWWTGDDNAFDYQNLNPGVLQPGGSYGTGKVGRAFSFNGNSEVTVPDSPSLDPQNFTIDAWVFPTAIDGVNDIIVNKETASTTQYEISIRGPGSPGQGTIPVGNLAFFIGGVSLPNEQSGWVNGGGPVPLNVWTHIALTWDGSNVGVYINGVLTRSITDTGGTVPTTAGPFRIGSRDPAILSNDPNARFNGLIDEVEFYNAALADFEIEALNNAGFAGKCKRCIFNPDNLVAWWPGDGDALDAELNGNDGTLGGGAGFALGKVGQAFSFNGTTGFVSVRHTPSQDIQNAITIDSWIMKKGACTGNCIVVAKQVAATGGSQNLRYALLVLSASGKASLSLNTGTWQDIVLSNTTIQDNVWYHLTGTYDGSAAKMYVNGILENSVGLEGSILPSTSGTIEIGHESAAANEFFNGLIDETEIFNRALSLSEIQSLVAVGTSGKCKFAGTDNGANVMNHVGDATLTFGDVSDAGTTIYQTLPTYQVGPMPFGYNNPLHVADISTDAFFGGGVRICFNLQATEFTGPFTQLRILHLEGNQLVNRTSSSNSTTRTICANVDTLSPFALAQNVTAPTAANGVVAGRITTASGAPVAGALIDLSGAQTRKTITDANGNYQFSGVETNGFYTVSPQRANFVFNPAARSFNQLGERTEAVFTGSETGDSSNPLDTPEFFVRQQYVDILGREPEEVGFNYWSDRILECAGDVSCANGKRRDVAAAFFIEREFQQTGSFVYGLYKGGLGRIPVFNEYSNDRQQVVDGVNLDARKRALAEGFVSRAEFVAKYQSNNTADSFVDALLANVLVASGVDLSSQRALLVQKYHDGSSLNQSRALVLMQLTALDGFSQAEFNPAFVLTEYFGYLRRDPDMTGFEFWLDVLNNREKGNFRGMVCAFITSREYQSRFSNVISHTNQECGR